MNKDEILEMKPGRELDAMVAEKVIGLECYPSHKAWMQSGMPHIQYWSGAVQYPAYWNEAHEEALSVPDYSTDICAVWEVVDKLKICITPQSIGAPEEYAYMVEYENEPAVKRIQIFSSTAPEAICKVALSAVSS